MELSRRSFLIAGAGMALAIAGCDGASDTAEPASGSAPESTDTQSEPEVEEEKTAAIGEPVECEDTYGYKFVVTVEGLESSREMTDEFLQYDNDIQEGQTVCLLLLVVENASEDIEEDTGYAHIHNVWLEGADGITLNEMNSGYDYQGYDSAPGYSIKANVGQTVKVAVPYALDASQTEYTVVIDGTRVPVTLTEGI